MLAGLLVQMFSTDLQLSDWLEHVMVISGDEGRDEEGRFESMVMVVRGLANLFLVVAATLA